MQENYNMSKYIISYDKNNKHDPFEDIIILLLNTGAIPNSINSPVESTFTFEWNQKICEIELHSILKNDLEKLCYYCLAECCIYINSKVKDNAIPSRKERIETIIKNFKK